MKPMMTAAFQGALACLAMMAGGCDGEPARETGGPSMTEPIVHVTLLAPGRSREETDRLATTTARRLLASADDIRAVTTVSESDRATLYVTGAPTHDRWQFRGALVDRLNDAPAGVPVDAAHRHVELLDERESIPRLEAGRRGELSIVLDRGRLAAMGLTARDVNERIADAIRGHTVLAPGGKDGPSIVTRLDPGPAGDGTPPELSRILIPLPGGSRIPLNQIATLEIRETVARIIRTFSRDGETTGPETLPAAGPAAKKPHAYPPADSRLPPSPGNQDSIPMPVPKKYLGGGGLSLTIGATGLQ